MKTIADHAIEYLKEHDLYRISAGQLGIIGEIADRSGVAERNTKHPHPLNRRDNVLDGLDRDDRFEKFYYRAHDSIGRPCTLRGYKLKEHAV
jgi:hypothetical protein